ncbi:MAG TPA: hypothetical protein VJ692_01840, partial [Nitrospiraceae bacterium]|nr:hypothetical protein [Nitrospiraceae bacterium]
MSKTMEQASLTGGSPAGRIEHAMSAQEQDRKERRFGIKEIGILLAVSATLVGLIAYGVYSHGARATSRMASSTAQAPLTPASEAPVASAAAP